MNTQLLDSIFLLFFSQLMPGELVAINQLHSEYDYRNKSGTLEKQQVEYIVNKQISLNKLKAISETQFEVGDFSNQTANYNITKEEYEKSVAAYYKSVNYTPMKHPLYGN